MEKLKNIIKKLIVEIDTNSMAKGLQIKDDIDGFLALHIYPKLSEYFDRAIPENELWQFEKIELEIDLSSAESIKDISPLIISKLAPEIAKAKTQNDGINHPKIKRRSSKKSKAQAFFEFLKKGRYPWWFQSESPVTIADIQLMNQAEYRLKFNQLIQSTNALNRLIYQFDYQYISKLFNLFYSEAFTVKPTTVFSFEEIIAKDLRFPFWSAVLKREYHSLINVFSSIVATYGKTISVLMEGRQKKSIKGLFLPKKKQNLLFELLEFCNENLEIPIQVSVSKSGENYYGFEMILSPKSAAKNNRKTARKSAPPKSQKRSQKGAKFASELEKKTGYKDALVFSFSTAISEAKKGRNKEVEITDKSTKITDERSIQKEEIQPQILDEEGTLLGNSGLVLLHPFLKHFFINLDLLDGKKIKPEKQDLAVHLLHYIATRNTEPSEHDLAFEKYLCDIPALQPVDRFIKLSQAQKESCDELLEAVLKHWSGLRTNAIDALRSEFLMREGKLTIKEDTHKLFVPRKTQDILLDTLPWNLHLVKLPWKKQMLYVEW